MKVMVDLDPRDVWRFEERAEQLSVRPGDVLRDELAARRRAKNVRDRIRDRVTAGQCDAEIAAEIGYPNGTVAKIRRDLGLPANRRYPRRTA